MSFSSEVKTELLKQCGKSRHCRLAELAGILELEGELSKDGIRLNSDNLHLHEKYMFLMKVLFDFDATKPLAGEKKEKLLSALHRREALFEEAPTNELLIQKTCCKRAFIRGAFMAAGSLSDPEKSYHFEIVCRALPQAKQLQQMMNSFVTDARIVERKGHYVVYLKEGSQIVDMLNVMEAYVSLMNLENVRILKEMRNSVNRKVNCETANINKTVHAAVRQIEDIRKIQKLKGFESLPEHLREIAGLRLEYPDATLAELGTYLDPPVGKSGVNHRLHKLSDIAADL